MSSIKHFDLEEAVRHAVYVESPDVEIDMDQPRKNLGGGFDVLDTDHPLRRLRKWIDRQQALALTCDADDILKWIEDDLSLLEKVE
jgi:hypothetical protein